MRRSSTRHPPLASILQSVGGWFSRAATPASVGASAASPSSQATADRSISSSSTSSAGSERLGSGGRDNKGRRQIGLKLPDGARGGVGMRHKQGASGTAEVLPGPGATAAGPGQGGGSSQEQAAGGEAEGGQGEEEGDGSETTEPYDVLRNVDKNAIRLFCSGCHKPTQRHDTSVIECNGCHRFYHPACHQRLHSGHAQGPNEDQMEGRQPWYHTPRCQQVLQALVQRASRGLQPIPPMHKAASSSTGKQKQHQAAEGEEEHAWRLIFCQRPGLTGQAALGQVHSVLSADWGYSLHDLREFDFAVLLKLQGSGVVASAALLDVYGPDVAELFVVSTRRGLRGQGLARELVLGALAPALAGAGVRRLAVSVDEGDEEASKLWAGYGFTPLLPPDQRQLAWQLPNFSREAVSGTTYYALDLRGW